MVTLILPAPLSSASVQSLTQPSKPYRDYPGLFAAYNADPGRYTHHLMTEYILSLEMR